MKFFKSLAVAASLLSSATAAQTTVSGTISGSLDQDDALWYVTDQAALPVSGWTETANGRAVRIVGFPNREPQNSDGALALEFSLVGGADAFEVGDARATLQQADEIYTASDPNIDLTISSVNSEGENMVITGSFFATMTPGETDRLVVDDPDARNVDGDFQATILPRGGSD